MKTLALALVLWLDVCIAHAQVPPRLNVDAHSEIAELISVESEWDRGGYGLRQKTALTKGQFAKVAPHITEPSAIRQISLTDCELSQEDAAQMGRFARLERLRLLHCAVSESAWKSLGVLREITDLDLSKTTISPQACDVLESLTQLQVLKVDGMDDSSLRRLVPLVNLVDLRLDGLGISDRGTASLRGLVKLRKLWLTGAQIADTGFLMDLEELENVSLRNTRIESKAMKDLDRLRKLAALDVMNTQVGDEGLRELENHPTLSAINLTNTGTTDRGLETLRTLPNLSSLCLQGTRVTRAGWVPLFDLPSFNHIDVRMIPESALQSTDFYAAEGEPVPLQESPNGKYAFKLLPRRGHPISYAIAQVFEKSSGRQIGLKLIHPFPSTEITCHAFSPDGQYLALGGGETHGQGWNVGNITVWEITTGELVFLYRRGRRGIGIVRQVAFASDSRGIHYRAEKYVRDGP